MEWNRQNIRGLLLVVCGGAAFYAALQHLNVVARALGWLVGILAPFLLGAAIAYVTFNAYMRTRIRARRRKRRAQRRRSN